MKNILIKLFTSFNKMILRLSQGRIGNKLGKQKILILHTIGRKSGQDHAIPIAYFDYKNTYLIVGSNWGKEKQADWYLNLKHDGHARLEIKGTTIAVIAREAVDDEYDQLWSYVTGIYPQYLNYQQMTSRKIPIMVFEKV
jgi:deazaflavin-dependent oxidoreductase (nitroreductase family)